MYYSTSSDPFDTKFDCSNEQVPPLNRLQVKFNEQKSLYNEQNSVSKTLFWTELLVQNLGTMAESCFMIFHAVQHEHEIVELNMNSVEHFVI